MGIASHARGSGHRMHGFSHRTALPPALSAQEWAVIVATLGRQRKGGLSRLLQRLTGLGGRPAHPVAPKA